MSGVYITGLEMPEEGTWLGLILYPDGGVREFLQPNKEYHAIPVPPHGRLIDADILYRVAVDRAEKRGDMFNEMDNVLSPRSIKMTPTVIPEEREEVDHEPPES